MSSFGLHCDHAFDVTSNHEIKFNSESGKNQGKESESKMTQNGHHNYHESVTTHWWDWSWALALAAFWFGLAWQDDELTANIIQTGRRKLCHMPSETRKTGAQSKKLSKVSGIILNCLQIPLEILDLSLTPQRNPKQEANRRQVNNNALLRQTTS